MHLSGLIDHFDECSCCHCKQSHVDVQIETLIRSSGLKASNPPFPTHCSGTVLDLVLSDEELSLPVEVVGDFLAQSDHRSTNLIIEEFGQVGEVLWDCSELWSEALLFF